MSMIGLKQSTVYKMYRDYGVEHWKYVAAAVLIGSIGTTLTQVPQIAFGLVIETIDPSVANSQFPFADSILSSNSEERVIEVSTVFLISVILISVFRFFSSYIWDVFQEKFQRDLRVSAYESVQNLHPQRFIQRSSGEYLSVVESDVREIGNLPRTVISGVSNDLVSVFTIGIVLFSLNWQFALILTLPAPFIAWYTFKFKDIIEPLYKETREASATLTNQLSSSIRGILTVRSYVAEEREIGRISNASDDVKETQLNVSKKWLMYAQVFGLTSRLSTFLVLSLGAFWVISGPPLFFTESLTAGELAVFFTNSTLLIQPATSLHNYVDTYKDSQASSDRVYSIMNAEEKDKKNYNTSIEDLSGAIEFQDTTFTYDFEDVDPLTTDEETDEKNNTDLFQFGPVSCKIEEGETIGIVGPSGSGKTTFLRLMMRFIDHDDGRIIINDEDISECNPRSLRDNMGYVEQEPYIFDSTMRDNIVYGESEATDDDLTKAIKNSALDDVIESLEDGVDIDLGESGGNLSGGERKRVAIARALISDPKVLVLDEATSHVDNITESKIQRSITNASKDRTTIMVAHRLSTVRNADRIFVFKDGQIIERGSHEELVEIDGLYKELWDKHVGILD